MPAEVIRLCGGILIALCGLLAGQFMAMRLKCRTELIGEYVSFLTQIQSIIGYTAEEAGTLLRNINGLRYLRPAVEETLCGLDSGRSFESSWRDAVMKNVPCREDRELMLAFGASFGTSNISGELSKLRLLTERAEQRHSELTEELKTKRRLYRTTGTFFGVMAAVVLI